MGQGFSGVPVGCYSEWRFKGALEITTTPTLAADQGNTPTANLAHFEGFSGQRGTYDGLCFRGKELGLGLPVPEG